MIHQKRPNLDSLRNRVLSWLVCLAAFSGGAPIAQTSLSGQVIYAQVEYTFGGQISFQANLSTAAPIQQIDVFLKPEGQADTIVIPASANPKSGEVITSSDLDGLQLRAFSRVEYWFQGRLTNGEDFTTPRLSFYYEDNRFRWQTLEGGPFRIHWYAGETGFAQEVLNTSQAGLLRVYDFLTVSPPDQIDIYVYDDARTMQSTLLLAGQEWVAGHADPDLGVILVSLSPGPDQHLEMERQVPHELMHVMLFRANPSAYDFLPAWFIEGLASITELYPHPDYLAVLDNSHQEHSLIPIASLCQVFPKDANGALLAYAEAASFTRFLERKYGKQGFENLIEQFAEGSECESGVELALGNTTERLELLWRNEVFSENPWRLAMDGMLPWGVILLAIFTGPLLVMIGWLRNKA